MPISVTTEWPKDGSDLRGWACTDADLHPDGGCKDFGPFSYPRRAMFVFETLTAQGHGVNPVVDDAGRSLQRMAESRRSIEAYARRELRQMCHQWLLTEADRLKVEADDVAMVRAQEQADREDEQAQKERAEAQAILVQAIKDALGIKDPPPKPAETVTVDGR